MQKAETIYQYLMDGKYQSVFNALYPQQTDVQIKRYQQALFRFAKIYGWDRKVCVYHMPYAIALTGEKADMALPFCLDAVAITATNNVNVSRLQARDYFGEDNVDLYQKGPWQQEASKTSGVLRGVQQAFRHFGFEVYGIDIYIDADTLPESGLADPLHLATLLAQIFNLSFNDGKLSTQQLSLAVQWALANYCRIPCLPIASACCLNGRPLQGDFSDGVQEKLSDFTPNLQETSFYTVQIGATGLEIPDNEIDTRLEGFLSALDIALDPSQELTFYTKLANLGQDCDKQAALLVLDYFTQENLFALYDKNAFSGTGAPILEPSLAFNTVSLGGSSKWQNHIYHPYTLVLCAVNKAFEDAFNKAMQNLFGENCTNHLMIAENGFKELFL